MLMRTAGKERFASVGPVGEKEGDVSQQGNHGVSSDLQDGTSTCTGARRLAVSVEGGGVIEEGPPPRPR